MRNRPAGKKPVAWALPFLMVVICPFCHKTIWGPRWYWNNQDLTAIAVKELMRHIKLEDGGHEVYYAYAPEEIK